MHNYQTKKALYVFVSDQETKQLEGKGEATRRFVGITSKMPQS